MRFARVCKVFVTTESRITPNQRYECHLGIPRITRIRPLHLIVLLREHLSAAITISGWYLIRALRVISEIRDSVHKEI